MNQALVDNTYNLILQASLGHASGKPKMVVGLSGGPDSVFLLYLLKKLEKQNLIKLHAAHLNHGWRETALRDEQFCITLCKSLAIPLTVEYAKNLVSQVTYNGSKEESGRKLRQHFFTRVREQESAHLIALAHHEQDQQETFFIKMLRGTSLSGLCGMQMHSGYYLRPLLSTSKQVIIAYLQENHITYMMDESNDSDDFLRNRVRKYLMPSFLRCDDRFELHFKRLQEQLNDDESLLFALAKQTYESLFTLNAYKIMVGDKKAFMLLHPALQKRVLLFWLGQEKVFYTIHRSFLLEIIRFLQSPRGGEHQLSPDWKIVKMKNMFWLERAVKSS